MNILNAVAVTAADGDAKNATKAGPLTGSSMLALEAKVLAGATPPSADSILKVIFATSKYDLTAADAPTILKNPSATLICQLSLSANGAAYYIGPAFIAGGDYLYCWVLTRSLGQAVTLTLDANERI